MKKLLILSLVLNALMIIGFIAKRIYYSSPHAPDQTFVNYGNQARTSVYNLFPIDSSDVVFLGTSLTEGFPLHEFFRDSNIKNRGISGNTSVHIMGRIFDLINGKPGKLFIEMGVNDINFGLPIDSLVDNYRTLLKWIKDISPRTTVYVQSILPMNGVFKHKQDSVVKANKMIQVVCREMGVTYIDVFRAMIKDGYLNPAYTIDGIHPNGAGYVAWKKVVEGYM